MKLTDNFILHFTIPPISTCSVMRQTSRLHPNRRKNKRKISANWLLLGQNRKKFRIRFKTSIAKIQWWRFSANVERSNPRVHQTVTSDLPSSTPPLPPKVGLWGGDDLELQFHQNPRRVPLFFFWSRKPKIPRVRGGGGAGIRIKRKTKGKNVKVRKTQDVHRYKWPIYKESNLNR